MTSRIATQTKKSTEVWIFGKRFLSLSSRFNDYRPARMAESVDALVSNTNVSNDVPVRPRLRVRKRETNVSLFFCVRSRGRSFGGGVADLSTLGSCLLTQTSVVAERLWLKINFRHLVHQPLQSAIALPRFGLLKPAANLRPPIFRESNSSFSYL